MRGSGGEAAALPAYIRFAQAERTLMFSSDYPHWDFDDPRHSLTALPAQIRQRVSVDNAVETYGERL